MMPSSNHKFRPESFDTRFVAAFRCTLAAAALFVSTIALESRLSFAGIAHMALVLYLIYSILLYTAAHRWHPALSAAVEPWFDVGWAVTLTVLSDDPRDVFAGFLFFTMLVTAFQWASAPGFRLARVAAILVLSLGMGLGYGGGDVGSRYALMGAAAMGMWGYLAVSFSTQQRRHKRRVALLKDVSRLSNRPLNVDHTLGRVTEQLRAFYDADACLLITPATHGAEYLLRRAERRSPERTARPEVLPMALTRLLLSWPGQDAVIFSGRHWFWRRCFPKARTEVIGLGGGGRRTADDRRGEAVATMLEAVAFITVPLPSAGLHGRLYMTAGRRGAFELVDVEWLQLVFDRLRPLLQNITLADQLAADAAEAERRRLALDVHDGVIQPYIGLQMGLEAVLHKLRMGSTDVKHDLDRLLHLTRDELAQLRHTVRGLKCGEGGFDGLVSALQRFGLKFMAATGIQVQIEVSGGTRLNDDLAAEVFHIVAEGLSNIRRHTQATTAGISLAQEGDHLRIQIRNDSADGEVLMPFTPRSIAERTMGLGGEVRIERQGPSHTAIIAEIPL